MQRFIRAILSMESLAKPANAGAAMFGGVIAPFLNQAITSGKFWSYLLLASVIAGDWISGTAASRKTGVYSSEYGIPAVFRTILILWIPFIGLLLDKVSVLVFSINQPGYAFYAVTFMLAYHSWNSLTANAYRAGWKRWIPKSVTNFVASEIKAKEDRARKQKQGS